MSRLARLGLKMMGAWMLFLGVSAGANAQDSLNTVSPDTVAVRQFVVVNLESKVPVRDILVCTDDGQETKTKWDGTFALRETFNRVNFVHPNYEKRYMLRDEIDGDTIGLLPNAFALNEVVIYGHDRSMALGFSAKLPKVEAQLLQSPPTGVNLLGLVAWGLDKIWLKKSAIERRWKSRKEK